MARVAFDPVGGPDFPKLIAALTNQGIAYIYGALSEGDTPIPVLEMIRKMPAVKGYSIRLVTGDQARRKVVASAGDNKAAMPCGQYGGAESKLSHSRRPDAPRGHETIFRGRRSCPETKAV